jgi:hypothetical protein
MRSRPARAVRRQPIRPHSLCWRVAVRGASSCQQARNQVRVTVESIVWEETERHVRCSVTCDTQQDAQDRIAATGATGGLVGKREVEERSIDEIDLDLNNGA